MTRGCLVFAHDSEIEYGSQAVLAARLVKKYLKVPVSIVSDDTTIANIQKKFNKLPFDKIIKINKPQNNKRYIAAQDYASRELVDFFNGGRELAWEVTPYDRTLIIDSDFLIFSETLNQYWNDPHDFLICPRMIDLQSELKEQKVGDYTIDLLWATNIMFTKNSNTKILFDLVKYIKEEYGYFAELYEFDPKQYRNDFAFSIALHIIGAHGVDPWHGTLSAPLFFSDAEKIVDIKPIGDIVFLTKNRNHSEAYQLIKCHGQDLHVLNKRDLLANLDSLLELSND
jgi:hypothetical protein